MINKATTPVFILCGGLGTRLKEETVLIPKPMVPIGSHPMLWHLMRCYARHGFKRFVLCCGYKGEVIKSYFLNYASMNSDFSVKLATNEVTVHSIDHDHDWDVTLAFTGELNMTGSRVAQAAERYLGEAEHFAVTYGDGLTDLDILAEFDFHLSHNKLGTVVGANPPSRFGELVLDGTEVRKFAEKPDLTDNWINAGFFFFRKGFLNYLSKDPDCVLERAPLVKLAQDGELCIFKHSGFWHCVDTKRDLDYMNDLWANGDAPWA